MSDPLARPRFVSLPDGRPLDALSPSRELNEALCDLHEKPRQGEPHEACLAVMNLVVCHCLGVKDMALVGLASEAGPLPFMGGPPRWPVIVLAVVATWPDDGPWTRWRAFVCKCVAVFAEHMQAPLWALDPAKVRESDEVDGIHDAESWLSTPAAPEAPAFATPKPREADATPKPREGDPPARKRAPKGDLDLRAVKLYAENPGFTTPQLARLLDCDASTLRNKKKCPLLHKARATTRVEAGLPRVRRVER